MPLWAVQKSGATTFSRIGIVKRRQLFEFTEIHWWPEMLRCLLTDFLHTLIEDKQPFSPKVSLIAQALRATSQNRVIDLCSGGIGPWLHLTEQLRNEYGKDVEVLLTDKFPNATAPMKVASIEGLECHPGSIDALNVPDQLKGARTLFNGLHHFDPKGAQGIIDDAVKSNQAIVVFELLQRTWLDVFVALLGPLAVLLFTPLVRPLSLSRLLFTYVIPIAPLVMTWDGLVSRLRCYTPDELNAMARNAGGENYEWHTGTYRHQFIPVTYMVGYPRVETSNCKSHASVENCGTTNDRQERPDVPRRNRSLRTKRGVAS